MWHVSVYQGSSVAVDQNSENGSDMFSALTHVNMTVAKGPVAVVEAQPISPSSSAPDRIAAAPAEPAGARDLELLVPVQDKPPKEESANNSPHIITISTSRSSAVSVDNMTEMLEMLDSWDPDKYLSYWRGSPQANPAVAIADDALPLSNGQILEEYPDSPLPDPNIHKPYLSVDAPTRPPPARLGRRLGLAPATQQALYSMRKFDSFSESLRVSPLTLVVCHRSITPAATTSESELCQRRPSLDAISTFLVFFSICYRAWSNT